MGWLVGSWIGKGVWHFQGDAPMSGSLEARWVAGGTFLEIVELVQDNDGKTVHEDLLLIHAKEHGFEALHLMDGEILPLAVIAKPGCLEYSPKEGHEGPHWTHEKRAKGFALRLWFGPPKGQPQITFAYTAP